MNMLQLGILGVVGVIFALQVKPLKADLSILICIAVSLCIFFAMVGHLEELIGTIRDMMRFVELEYSYLGMILKMLGITYVSEFSSAICKDAGYQTIANQIEIFGKLTILVMSLPIILSLMETILEFVG
jgi:stage III sporulation protein AD